MGAGHSHGNSQKNSQATDTSEMVVRLQRDANDYRAMHTMIEIQEGETREVWEASGWRQERPITSILALFGFAGSARSGQSSRVPLHVQMVTLRSFVVTDPETKEQVRERIPRAISGNLGGFHPVVHGQVGFHQATWAFDYVWSAAGRPPMRVHHPEVISGVVADEASPAEMRYAAEQNGTLATVRMAEGTLPGLGGTESTARNADGREAAPSGANTGMARESPHAAKA